MPPLEFSVSLIFILMVSSGHGSKIALFFQDLNSSQIATLLDSNNEIVEISMNNLQQTHVDEVCSRNLHPSLILDFTIVDIPSETTKKISKFAHIPTITTTYGGESDFLEWMELSDKHKNIFLQIKQPADLVPHIVRAIVEFHNYTNAGIIYDNNFVMLHKLKMLLLNMEVRHTFVEYKILNPLLDMNKLEIFNYFIIGSENTISRVLAQACENNLFEIQFSWYGITLEEFGQIHVNCSAARYVVASPKLAQNNFQFDFKNNSLPRLTKEFYHDVIRIGFDVSSRLKPSSLTLCEDGSKESIQGKDIIPLVKAALTKNAQTRFLFNKFHIHNLWNSFVRVEMQLTGSLVNGTSVSEEHIADWTSEHLTSLNNIGNIDTYKSKIIYRIAVAVQEPFLFPDPTSKYNYSGYCIDLIEEIGKVAGFTFLLYRPEGSGFRYDFNASIYDVKKEIADIALGSIPVNNGAATGVDFTIPFYELVGMQIMMKIQDGSQSSFKIIEVLHPEVWGVLLILFFVSSFLIWIYDKFSPYSYQNNKDKLEDSSETREFTVKESLWFALTSLTPQGGGEVPRPLSSKIAVGLWWFFGFLIIASYTAILAAFLTASYLESQIESLDDLSQQYQVKYFYVNGSRTQTYFEVLSHVEQKAFKFWLLRDNPISMHDYTIDNMYTKMLMFIKDSNEIVYSLEEALAKVQASTSSKNYAYIGDATDIKFAVLTHCDVQAVGEEFAKKFYGLVVKSGSPLKEKLDAAIMHLLNERILERLKIKWWRENAKEIKCTRPTEGISIQNILGVLLLIGGGVIASLVFSGVVRVYEKKKMRKVIQDQSNQNETLVIPNSMN